MKKVLIVLSIMIASIVVQYALWDILNPYGWILLFPASFASIAYAPVLGAVIALPLSIVAEYLLFFSPNIVSSILAYVITMLGLSFLLRAKNRGIEIAKKALEDKRSEAEANFEQAFTLSPVPLVISYSNGLIQVNTAFVQTFGYSDLTTEDEWVKRAFPGQKPVANWHSLANKTAQNVVCADGQVKQVLVGANKSDSYLLVSMTDISWQKRMSSELDILHTAIEQSPTSVILTNDQVQIIYVNPEFTRITGYTAEEVLGLNPKILSSGLTDKRVFSEMWSALAASQFWRGEFVNKRKNGEIYYEEAHVAPVQSDGKTFYVAVDFDKTSQIMMERMAKHEAQKARALFDISNEGIHVLDLSGQVLMVNPAFCRHLGYSEQELLTMNVGDWDIKYSKGQQENLLRCCCVKEGLEFETIHRCKDGSVKNVSVNARSWTYEGTDYVYAASRDITERLAHESYLRLTSKVFESSSEGIIITDSNTMIVQVNKAFTEITGYSEQEVIGQTPKLLSSGRHDKEFYRSLWEAIRKTGHWRGEIWNKRKGGTIYPEWLNISCIKDENDQIINFVGVFSDISKWKDVEKTIWDQANYDPLTGLPNRRLFVDTLDMEIAKNNSILALFFLDLDRFKEVNDSLGHDYGDKLLIEAGRRIKSCVRDTDLVSRLGGDEFTIIVPNLTSERPAHTIAQNLAKKLCEPFQLNEHFVYVSASIGITFYPSDARDVTGLIKCADQAMYTAKYNGRNQFSFFTQEMSAKTLHKLRLAHDMRVGMDNDQFFMVYQPIIDLESGQIVKAESLIRWNHPELERIGPDEFIPIAENSGFIHNIGDFVLDQALRVSLLLAEYEISLSINKSPSQFVKNGQHWAETLSKSDAKICIEITEGVLLQADDSTKQKLLLYRDLGIEIAVDDFGTGCSNLAYLKKFDIDILKIDQSFVRNMTQESDDRVLCEAITVMAHRLGILVVAEGVETKEQHDLLCSMGVNYGQGYYYSRPLSEKDFLAFVESKHVGTRLPVQKPV